MSMFHDFSYCELFAMDLNIKNDLMKNYSTMSN
jgi:hypothetical protein